MRTVLLALCALACLASVAQAQIATYYGKEFAGRRTASGERFNPGAMTARTGRSASGRGFELRTPVTAGR
jgi:hypothetical protein